MKKLTGVLALAMVCASAYAQDQKAAAAQTAAPAPAAAPAAVAAQAPQGLQTEKDKTLYAIGYYVGQGLDTFMLKPEELTSVQLGIADAATGVKAQIPVDDYRVKITDYIQEKQSARAVIEKKKGDEYAAKAAAETGAVKLSSGIIVIPVTEGTGAYPTASDMVKVHYTGKDVDGNVFDSSVEKGEPVVFPLDMVIPCWTAGMQKIKVGGKAKLVCPSDTAYGDVGRSPKIAPGATLVFDVELISIEKEEAPAAPAAEVKPAAKSAAKAAKPAKASKSVKKAAAKAVKTEAKDSKLK